MGVGGWEWEGEIKAYVGPDGARLASRGVREPTDVLEHDISISIKCLIGVYISPLPSWQYRDIDRVAASALAPPPNPPPAPYSIESARKGPNARRQSAPAGKVVKQKRDGALAHTYPRKSPVWN
jgi:hypothetical protein